MAVRRFGPRVGGLIGGLPVVAGPILLVLALLHGRSFGANAATGSLLGLGSLAAFVTVYAAACPRVSPPTALVLGWCTFLAATVLLAPIDAGAVPALAVACGSFWVAMLLIPRPVDGTTAVAGPPAWDLPVRAACAGAMVVALTAASAGLGAHVSGLLAPFPVITSVLAAFTHAQRGPGDTLRLLQGMLIGLFAFALFCFTVAVGLRHGGIAVAFGAATTSAILIQGVAVTADRVRTRRLAAARA
ncbi:MAG TPA: hypothetical protein VFT50_01420 [Baekduia sp.]|nr:hypothetical protein [Baekduia sp.]